MPRTHLAAELEGAHVLVVDDDAGVRHLLQHLLTDAGYHAVGAHSLAQARETMRHRAPDAVLLDLDLGGEDGLTLLQQLRTAPETASLPVIVISGQDRPERRRHAAAADIGAFLAKPFDNMELQLRLESLIRRKRATDALEESGRVLVTLARALEARDPQTAGHSERVACLAVRLGRRIGMAPSDLTCLEQGAWVHDLGKVGISDGLLRKPGPLDAGEQAELQRHPLIGVRIIENLRTMAPVLPIVRWHHERLDGSGYPDGLRGEAIPLAARVVAVADVYDALTSGRPYRAPMRPAAAVEVLEREVQQRRLQGSIVAALRAEAGPFD